MHLREVILASLLLSLVGPSFCQTIIDQCFTSEDTLGFFNGSENLRNICDCENSFLSSDLIEWDPVNQHWLGTAPSSNVTKKPPLSCKQRGIWMGYNRWTVGGEAFALRLDHPLELGKKYSYSFTYASDGFGSDNSFSPVIYSSNKDLRLNFAYMLGSLPATNDWTTNAVTFIAGPDQVGHNWLIIHAINSSGIVLSNCNVDSASYEKLISNIENSHCQGTTLTLDATRNLVSEYEWNTGMLSSSILVNESGVYKVKVKYLSCVSEDSIVVQFNDCEARVTMPNIFTPNNDNHNDVFFPIEYNYLQMARMRIYNRWGQLVFNGDLFLGWSGNWKDSLEPLPTGIYYFEIEYISLDFKLGYKKGTVTLFR